MMDLKKEKQQLMRRDFLRFEKNILMNTSCSGKLEELSKYEHRSH